jgi:hypothetical protein
MRNPIRLRWFREYLIPRNSESNLSGAESIHSDLRAGKSGSNCGDAIFPKIQGVGLLALVRGDSAGFSFVSFPVKLAQKHFVQKIRLMHPASSTAASLSS